MNNITYDPISPSAIDKFHENLRRAAEQRRVITLARNFSAFATKEEALAAAETVMEMRRRKNKSETRF